MKWTECALEGAWKIEAEKLEDERGFFARQWCRDEFKARGLSTDFAQVNISFNNSRGTLRGMHFQAAPHQETKVVRCTRGAIYDVIVDLRPQSPTFRQWIAVELTADNYTMLYVPEDFAHGFITLADDSEVLYLMSRPHAPEAARGVPWNDPALNIAWPIEIGVISARDQNWPDLSSQELADDRLL